MAIAKDPTLTPKWLLTIRIQRTNKSTFIHDFKKKGRPDLDQIEKVLTEELKHRRSLKVLERNGSGSVSANAWLKETCYAIITAIFYQNMGYLILLRLKQHNRLVVAKDRDIFEKGIVALFAQNPDIISVKDRGRLTDSMWHGFRHYIPPALLNGFNAQYPAHRAKRKGWRRETEPALREWYLEQKRYAKRRRCPLEHHRGKYGTVLKRPSRSRKPEPAPENAIKTEAIDSEAADT